MALEEDWCSFSWVKLNKGANPTKNSDEFYNPQELITHLSSINTCRISGIGWSRRWSSSSWTWRKDGVPDPWLSRTRRIWNSSWKTGPQHAGMSTPLTRLCSNTVFVQAWYRVAAKIKLCFHSSMRYYCNSPILRNVMCYEGKWIITFLIQIIQITNGYLN